MPEAEVEAPKEEQKPPKAKGGGKLVPAILVVNSTLLAGVLVLMVLRPGGAKAGVVDHGEEQAQAQATSEKADKGDRAKEAAPGPMLRLPDFVVHLRDADADRYVRVAFEVEVPDEKGKEALSARMPKIRDAFLAYLSDRSADELRGSEAMARLKGALSQRLAELAPNVPLRGLYVADLVVQ